MKDKISVIIPIYNMEEYLNRCLDSILGNIAMCNFIQTNEYTELNAEFDKYHLSEKMQGVELLHSHRRKTYAWGKLYNREVLRNIDFQEGFKGGEDALFNMKVICNNKNISAVYLKEILYFYFEREQSLKSTLNSFDILYLCKMYNELESKLNDKAYSMVLNTEIFKRALFARYYESLLRENKNNYIESKYYLKLSFGRLVKSKELSYRNKIVYFFFKISPLAYRIFRILNDPTMLYWEQNCRKNRKKR